MMNKLRTPHGTNCNRKINNLFNFFSEYPECLIPEDRTYVQNYVAYTMGILDMGLFDTPGLLKGEEWNIYNVRYDLMSIKGTDGEIQSCILQNKNQTNGTLFSLYPSDEEGQKHGLDVMINNKRRGWKRPYVGQVKGLYLDKFQTELQFYQDWFDDLYIGYVDRLLMVDINKHILIEVDFNEVMKALGKFEKDETHKTLPIEFLKGDSKFWYSMYTL